MIYNLLSENNISTMLFRSLSTPLTVGLLLLLSNPSMANPLWNYGPIPTDYPTRFPTHYPTNPTNTPTNTPTATPTAAPTKTPTAPTAAPKNPASAIVVSLTLSPPNFVNKPWVTPKGPPQAS